ncbi:single-stranded DNA-binding protein [Streptomyces sp. NPDC056069]|uniref:single-stranded DNA-binding protein n=1 Tax=Streptomyces sp. NPDC056069 TaxID=3345702 RepID=UPI0035DBDA0D
MSPSPDTWRDGEPTFLDCSAFRQLAENLAASLTKGARVVVAGRLRTDRGRPRRVRSAPGWSWT